MATSTNKYKLTKPEQSEKVQVEVLNANMDLIDSALNDLQNQATANKNKADSTTQSLQTHIDDKNNPHSVTKGQLGLGNVENKSSATIRGELTKNNVTNALGYTPYTPNEVDNKLSALETKIDWKEAVNTFNDIATTYPDPQDGWTVNVKDTDYTYRFDGDNWVVISANAIPKATQSVDGLLSKEDKANYDDANSKKHTHNNKSILDKITQSLLDNWNAAYTHISDTIKHISSTERTNWTDAYNKRHTHNNKSVLDGITSSLISAWNNATDHISDTVKHITNAERTLWNTIVNKVDKIDGKGLSTNDYTTVEKEKLRNVAAGTEVNVQSDWNATDTGSDDYIKNKPTSMKNPAALTFMGGVTGTYDGSSAKTVTIPTSLPASNTTSDYSATGIAPVNGVAVNKALQTLDVASKGETGKYIQSISETDGKISAVEATMPTSLPANGGTAETISDTLPISKGGTGKTTGADGFKALLDGVGTGTDTPKDDDWYLSQYAGGSAASVNNQTPVKRKISSLWNYIKSKLATVATSGSYNDLTNRPTIPAAVRVKGNAETAYRTGDVNITPSNIGLGNVNNTSDENKNVSSALRLRSRGAVAAETGANLPAVAGLSMSQAYNNGYPTSYGNVLTLYDGGVSQLMLGWSGSDKGIVSLYYRNKRDVASNQWSDWREIAFTTSNVASATKATNDSQNRNIADTYAVKSEYNLIKKYTIDLNAQSNSNFYFVSFTPAYEDMDCEIHSPSLGGNDPYNQNVLHFVLCSAGWSDTPTMFKILNHSVYSTDEITIGSVVRGQKNGMNGVYLRGGKTYKVWCNYQPTLRLTEFSNGSTADGNLEKFPSGTPTAHNTGFTGVEVLIDFTNSEYKGNYMYSRNQIKASTFKSLGGGTSTDGRTTEVNREGFHFNLPANNGFAGGMTYNKSGAIRGAIGFFGDQNNASNDYYYMGEAYNNANGHLKVGRLTTNGDIDLGGVAGTSGRQIAAKMALNDWWRIIGTGTGDNAGYLDIGTGDDGSEPIYISQYTGTNTLKRRATILDGSGNTSFPGSLSVGGEIHKVNSLSLAYGGGDTAFASVLELLTYVKNNSLHGGVTSAVMVKFKAKNNWCPTNQAWNVAVINMQDALASGATIYASILLWSNVSGVLTDATHALYLGHITTNNTESGTYVQWTRLYNSPFRFGKDSNGNYGYYKDGADTVTPFLKRISAFTPAIKGTLKVSSFGNMLEQGIEITSNLRVLFIRAVLNPQAFCMNNDNTVQTSYVALANMTKISDLSSSDNSPLLTEIQRLFGWLDSDHYPQWKINDNFGKLVCRFCMGNYMLKAIVHDKNNNQVAII